MKENETALLLFQLAEDNDLSFRLQKTDDLWEIAIGKYVSFIDQPLNLGDAVNITHPISERELKQRSQRFISYLGYVTDSMEDLYRTIKHVIVDLGVLKS